MKSCLLAATLAVLSLSANSALAAEPHKDGMTVKEIQSWLMESGYKAEIEKGDSGEYIRSSSDGVSFEVYPNDCRKDRCASVQLVAAFDLDVKMTADKANAWNSEKRYVDCYIDDEGDPWFTYDINVSPGGTRAALDDDFGVWLSFLPDIKAHIGW
ncbi:hypothetical protein ASE17_06965 [Phenylobacterium sp. Root77]|uniref:YbjN domain-containing protein n=1 Tax=unclassified Phenylobacterium TaxID=2640670 RepID=UPI0006FCFD8D|nr:MULTISPECIES: YbjN domain-containing protein [unclassified Phenylobacterium]KQW68189.1 hypothetical protein ASC73_16870 [Phenylobacterium sp. Root1277]KQW91930.1 hypothetical protein ASC79_10245 [Phenylobacterium sp. Root1290]KRC40162.1 hypothetical protein ASE17_06965 [Phenylobacterium sp. Root77]